jgi:cytochrome P450
MFSTSGSKVHSQRKRMLSNVYSKSHIQNSKSMHESAKVLLLDRFMPALDEYAKTGKAFDAYSSCFSAVTMDFVTSYQFGLASSADLQRSPEFLNHFLKLYRSRHSYNFWAQETPTFKKWLKRVGIRLIPEWVDAANGEIEDWVMKMCEGAAAQLSTKSKSEDQAALRDYPEVYAQLSSSLDRADEKSNGNGSGSEKYIPRLYPRHLDIASEMLDHLAAGFETSSITLTYFVHEISQRPDVQSALRAELRGISCPLRFPIPSTSEPDIPSGKVLDALPLLEATLRETLRLRSAIPGPEPRITPMSGCVIGPPESEYFIPGNVRISSQAHTLHRNADVYEDPESWKPERWTKSSDEKLRDMNKSFWAFGSGGRMCVGSNLAMHRKEYRSLERVRLTWNRRNEVYYCRTLLELGDCYCG